MRIEIPNDGKPFFKQRNKYNSKKSGGYHSQFEKQVAADLQLRQRAGEISDLQEQQRYKFKINGKTITTSIVDFKFKEGGKTVWYEAKGFPTNEWKIKHKLMIALLPLENPEGRYYVHWANGKIERFV